MTTPFAPFHLTTPTMAGTQCLTALDILPDVEDGVFLMCGRRLLPGPRAYFVRRKGVWVELDPHAWQQQLASDIWRLRSEAPTHEWLASWRNALSSGGDVPRFRQKDLAALLGVSERTIKDWEHPEKSSRAPAYLWRALRDWEAHRFADAHWHE